MNEDSIWFVSLLAVALVASVVLHSRLKSYGAACFRAALVSGLASMAIYTALGAGQITKDNFGQLLAWVGVLFLPGFLCGLCVSALTGLFLLARRKADILRES